MAELLLELLSEEIPARMQARATDDLKRLVSEGLKAAGLAFTDARAFATPRRLALVVGGLPTARADVSEERRGPRVGAPDQAIQGFLKGAGLASLEQAEKRDTGKGEFWFAVLKKKGGPTADALPGIVEAAMKALPWPKSMKWGSGTMTWVRPLQSIVALFDGKVLAGEVAPGGRMAPIRFGATTRGHRFLSKGEIKVSGFADYTAKLRAAHVILDPAERRRIIEEGASALCGEAQVTFVNDEGLLDEVAGLVEWPVPLLGRIDEDFLKLPHQVLVSSMRTHQRYFATWKREQSVDDPLSNRFVVVANNVARDGGKTIIDGNERVLRARLSDAKFFWDQDRKVTLESRLQALKGVYFHTALGTQYERIQRISSLAKTIRDRENSHALLKIDYRDLETAVRLCKADLVTGMVGEFPELQGVIGEYYARHDGLSFDIAAAIREHYSPLGPADVVPTRGLSVVVALADKLDSLVGFFGIGETPTGSRDPFALRRSALGVIRLIVENGLRLSLRPVLNGHVDTFNGQGSVHLQAGGRVGRPLSGLRQSTTEDVLMFLAERLKVQMREKGVRHDVVDAVFALGGEDDLIRLLARVGAVQSFLTTDAGKNLLTAYGRAANIVRAEEKKDKALVTKIVGAPDPELFEQDEETALYARLIALSLLDRIENEDFVGAMNDLAWLREPIDAFFEKVTVNVPDNEKLRVNRLRLLKQIQATMDSVADFSRIEG
jgi:glycyl-tRNA synthetase beta chain